MALKKKKKTTTPRSWKLRNKDVKVVVLLKKLMYGEDKCINDYSSVIRGMHRGSS